MTQREQAQLANIMRNLRKELIAEAKEQDSQLSSDSINQIVDRACTLICEHLIPVPGLLSFLSRSNTALSVVHPSRTDNAD
jgi:hypothetical protein